MLAIIVAIIDIVSYIGIGQSNLVKQMEQNTYLQSEDFICTLADLTYYLGQCRIEDNGERDERYDSLQDLLYYIEGEGKLAHNNVKLKKQNIDYLDSKVDFYTQLGGLKENSDFFMSITITGDTITGLESSLNNKSQMTRFKGRYATLVNHHEDDYTEIEAKVYFFIPKGQVLKNDYLASQVIEYNGVIQNFIYIMTQIVCIGIYLILLAITTPIATKDDWGIRLIKRIPIEIKVIMYMVFYKVVKEIVWFIDYSNEGNIYSNLFIDSKALSIGYGILVVGLLSVLGYGIRDLIGYYQDGIVQSVKENSIFFKKNVMSRLLRLVGVDIRYPAMMKLFLLNMGHLIVLSALIFISATDFLDAIRWAMIWCSFGVIFTFAINKDWQKIIEQVEHINVSEKGIEHLDRLKKYKSYLILGITSYTVILFALISLSSEESFLGFILAIGISVGVAVISWKVTESSREIYIYITQILNLKNDIKSVTFLSPIVGVLSEVEESFNEAVQKEVTSQRMKTELISNVSHDLKTPLTSIISYIDLLKREDLSKEEQKKYIEILDKQSQRLKILIEDLFEASKAASGNIEFVTEEIDLVALLKQTLGEMSEKVECSNLQFKVNIPDEKVMCKLDGRRTYRIFGNLVNNILKYAAPYSRVYIEFSIEEDETIINFKNMSAKEMNFTAEEIVERFKRGDESRHTEGSGLGLAIAKNLTELQGGVFEIYIDGDLFKVTLRFKRVREEHIELNKHYVQEFVALDGDELIH